jgi:hypothetical protein
MHIGRHYAGLSTNILNYPSLYIDWCIMSIKQVDRHQFHVHLIHISATLEIDEFGCDGMCLLGGLNSLLFYNRFFSSFLVI